ncbi:hypothetical protein LIER_25304 [Lithospermum erythrorhizon]|uniref:Uncharacterized protein n=1 Tax=Lithospermum erythrorhizon TaxID=34254 RepID=A0AAV3R5I9_LITER
MVKTRRGDNTSGKATKGKKKGAGTSDDTCMVVERPVVNGEAQTAKGQKSKVPASTSMEEELMLNPTPIRSVPPVDITHNVIQERAAKKARKAERRARRAAHEAVEEAEAVPTVTQLAVDDEWFLEHEPQGGDAQEEVQDSDFEDVAAMMSRSRKAKGKLRMN